MEAEEPLIAPKPGVSWSLLQAALAAKKPKPPKSWEEEEAEITSAMV